MYNVTCFVLQLAHLLARWEDKASRIRLKRFVFFSTFQLAYLLPDRGAHLLHDVLVGWVEREGEQRRTTTHPPDITQETLRPQRSLTLSYCLNVPLKLPDESCHISNDVSLSLHLQIGTNAKKLTQFHRWVQSQNSQLYFPHWKVPYML